MLFGCSLQTGTIPHNMFASVERSIELRRAVLQFCTGTCVLALSACAGAAAYAAAHSALWFVACMALSALSAAAGSGVVSILREGWLPVVLTVLGLVSGFVSVFFAVPFLQMKSTPVYASSLAEIQRGASSVVLERLSVRLDLSGEAPVYVETEDSFYRAGTAIAAPLVDERWTRKEAVKVWAVFRERPGPESPAREGVVVSPLDFGFEEFTSARKQSEALHSIRSDPDAILLLVLPSLSHELRARRNAAATAAAILLLVYAGAVVALGLRRSIP